VFHVAASSDVKESMINPKKYFENNTVATMNILEAMRKKDATKIIFTSSSVVYGISNKINFENSQKDPISVYGLTKLMCEDAIKTYCNAYGFNGIILRLANIVGKRAPKGIIHDMVTKFKKNPNEIEVLGDGNQTKSYLHVSDCVNAIVACYKHMNHQKNACEIYNVANSDHIRVKYIVRCIANEMSIPKFKIKYVRHNNAGAGWHGDLTTSKLSISKLKRLSWAPKHSCESAIRLTVKQILQKS
jgi:UDP-glucose 4-epimerase